MPSSSTYSHVSTSTSAESLVEAEEEDGEEEEELRETVLRSTDAFWLWIAMPMAARGCRLPLMCCK